MSLADGTKLGDSINVSSPIHAFGSGEKFKTSYQLLATCESGHWTLLRILWIKDGLTQKELSDLAWVMEPTIFSAVKAMEGMGLIER